MRFDVRRVIGLAVIGKIRRCITDPVADCPQLSKRSIIDLKKLGEFKAIDAGTVWPQQSAIGCIHDIRSRPAIHGNHGNSPVADDPLPSPRRLGVIATGTCMQETAAVCFFQCGQHTGWAKIKGMIVGERQRTDAEIIKGIEHPLFTAPEI